MNHEPAILAPHADFLVVAKPSHVLSHPTRPDGEPTLLGWLQEKFPGEFVALVNRLDRETSGTVLVARSPEATSRLGGMTMRREIHKYYLALVSGRVETEHGVIDAPIGRLGISEENPIWLRRGVIPSDDPQERKTAEARTEFWLLGTSGPEVMSNGVAPTIAFPNGVWERGEPEAATPISLLRLQAHTGRLHQLRVHLAHIGASGYRRQNLRARSNSLPQIYRRGLDRGTSARAGIVAPCASRARVALPVERRGADFYRPAAGGYGGACGKIGYFLATQITALHRSMGTRERWASRRDNRDTQVVSDEENGECVQDLILR